MDALVHMSNATKGLVSAFLNTVLVLVIAFGVELSTDQVGAIMACVNAGLALWIGLTYRQSAKRIAD